MVAAVLLAFSGVVLAQQTDRGEQRQPADGGQTEPEEVAEGEVLVKFEPGTLGRAQSEAHRQGGGQVQETIPGIGVQLVRVPPGTERASVARYQQNPNVRYAELNGVYKAIASSPNDPRVGEQWGYNNTGQSGGTADSDINAFEAWNYGGTGTLGSSSVKIAILDTGIKANHTDLSGKVATGRNFTSSGSSTDTNDKNGHGTHVAGTAAAKTNNSTGVAGTCPNCTLVPVKVLSNSGSGSWSWIANGLTWAANNGAHVANLSLGGSSGSNTIRDAVNYAYGKGTLIAAAAGNANTDDDHFPSDYTNTISVGATDAKDNKASFSNYGDKVDIGAPGASILSTTKNGGYASWSGTSMATPHVAGVAGLVFSKGTCNGKTGSNLALCVRNEIELKADKETTLNTYWVDGRRLRADSSLS
jgi:thermitase